MTNIKASELSYCRVQVPDLAKAEQFLVDFGLRVAAREPARTYLRGSDPHAYCYVLEQGESRFLGFGLHAKSLQDLHSLADSMKSKVEPIEAPGGGQRVRLTEPNGYEVDLVFGMAAAEPMHVPRQELNSAAHPLRRAGELYRLQRGQPTPIRRLAHVVLASPKFAETQEWFRTVLGLVASDNITAGPQRTHIGSFMRVDCAQEYVDHHAVAVFASPKAGVQHLSFESQDVDAVLGDHHHLRSLGRYEHLWGVGRHLLGSQVFDYWMDPNGIAHEHWADSDRLNASATTHEWDVRDGLANQWGDPPPERFTSCVHP
jgi:catechol 2,3-dioxygenase-like lactoylglutathione lyase family enzyme